MTDIKIQSGDTVIEDNGIPQMIEGIQLAVQQARLAAKIPKGSFVYDRGMGICTENIDYTDEKALGVLEMSLNECLVDAGVGVRVNSAETRDGKTYAEITVYGKYENLNTEVIIDG